ncbi:type II toxin-antitoxin system RelE/ParE family toxin [Roseobacter cerasinus]|nr:type II toxin-antitoxin system RelE/ParE family toxin [Roseobacter cerasinus]
MDTIEELASGQKQGRDVDIRDRYLKYPVGRHFVFFRRSDGMTDVIRVLHQSMDSGLHLLRKEAASRRPLVILCVIRPKSQCSHPRFRTHSQ